MTRLKFGDVVEWDIPGGVIRWLIICDAPPGYGAIWLDGYLSQPWSYTDRRPVVIMNDPTASVDYRVVASWPD